LGEALSSMVQKKRRDKRKEEGGRGRKRNE